MYVNTYVLEKLVDAWLAERRADAARIAAIETAATTLEPVPAPGTAPAAEKARASGDRKRAPRSRWIELQLGR